MSEHIDALNTAIHTALSGTALTSLLSTTPMGGGTVVVPSIFYQMAPDNAAYPYVIYSYAGGPGHENNTRSETVNELVWVRGYNTSGPALAGSISAQIDASLHGRVLNASGWANFWTVRTQTITPAPENVGLVKVWSLGSFYHFRLSKT